MPSNRPSYKIAIFCFSLIAAASILSAAPPNRIAASRIDDTQRVYLTGHISPKAQAQYDRGPVSPQMLLSHVTLELKPSAAQQADLDQLLVDQQNPASANFHHWLTPDDFAARFGVSDADLAKLSNWLQSQGLTVTSTARAKNWIAFDGNAAQVQRAFQTELHQYVIGGEAHFANPTEPSIPAALQPVIRGIRGLNDFRMQPRSRNLGLKPQNTGQVTGNHYLAPDDLATIYDFKALLNSGIDGTGQKIVVVGQTAINLSDLEAFRSTYNLPGQDPQVILVPGTTDPGVLKKSGDLGEADLDLEWSAAVARNASIIFVYAPGVDQATQYAIDQNLAPVLTMSYGLCELDDGQADALILQSEAQQANAQGMTWFAAAGDSGGATCSGDPNPNTNRGSSPNSALASVDLPAAVPGVTGVGGTEFAEGAGTYWNPTNDVNGASVLSYIPEVAWNDSAIDGSPSASGGGASAFFSKPSWQTGAGVPADGMRDVPDVSLSASADHDGYIVYTSGSLSVFGGTSVSTPSFAGIAALLNQYLVTNKIQATPGLGNINPKLYTLAQTVPGVFHDITVGDNIVTPLCGSRACIPATTVGFPATPNYDLATGLGSVDVLNLVSAWAGGGVSRPIPQMQLSASNPTLDSGGATVLTATLISASSTTPTGSVTFLAGTTTLGTAQLSGSNGASTASLTVAASQLPSGANTITAQYNSDTASFSNTLASITVTVASGSTGSVVIAGVADGAAFQHAYAPGAVLSVFGTQLANSTLLASSVPLPLSMAGVSATVNGVSAPLYLVSPSQINLQIPYATPAGATANLKISNNGQTASYSFAVSSTAPAIFTDGNNAPVPNTSAATGAVVTLFVTGAGAVSPSIATGSAPATGTSISFLPRPVNQPVSVTVGGLNAPIQFSGIPVGLVGVLQINYQVPSGLTPGVQPVVVTIGKASSPQANLTITQ